MFTVLNIPMKCHEQTNLAALDHAHQTETHLRCFSANHTQKQTSYSAFVA